MTNPAIEPYLDNQIATKVDQSNLARILGEFPRQLESASYEFNRLGLAHDFVGVEQVLFCGMGGSAIAAQLATDLPPGLLRKPVLVIRDYDLPAWAGKQTAVVIISYSGDTAEALVCFDQALHQAGVVVVVTSGGKLFEKAEEAKVPIYRFTYQAPPRDALGYLFVPAVAILEQTKVLTQHEIQLTAAIELMHELGGLYAPATPTPQNPAKQLAYMLYDHVPVIIGSNITRSVARRWKNQFNEHAKTTSWFDELPEANHNTVEGLTFPARFKDDAVIIFLTSNFDHPEVVKRQGLWREHLKRQGIQSELIEAKGQDIWSNKLSLVYLGDWVSYYLALLYRIDPAIIPTINELKGKLGGV